MDGVSRHIRREGAGSDRRNWGASVGRAAEPAPNTVNHVACSPTRRRRNRWYLCSGAPADRINSTIGPLTRKSDHKPLPLFVWQSIIALCPLLLPDTCDAVHT